MSNIKIVKLDNGESIIGVLETPKIVNEEGFQEESVKDILFIKYPRLIIADYDKKTQTHGIFIVDWVPGTGDLLFPIPKSKIITMCNPSEELENHYVEIALVKYITEGHEDETDEEMEKRALFELLNEHEFDDEDKT